MDSPKSLQLTTDDSKHREALANWLSRAKARIENPLLTVSSSTDTLVELANALSVCGPMRVYKYQPYSERNVQDFLSESIHLAPLRKLNDRFEGYLHFDEEFSKHAYESILQMDEGLVDSIFVQMGALLGREVDEQSIGAFKAFLNDKQGLSSSIDALDSAMLSPEHASDWIRSMRGVQRCASLSSTPLSPSMWDRYARGHEGFVTGYSVSEFTFSCSCERGLKATCSKAPTALLCPVVYTNDTPTLGPLHAAWIALSLMGAKMMDVVVLYNVLSLCHKSRFWSNELEWRLITSCGPCGEKQVYAHLRPDSVFLGVSMGGDDRLRVIEAATEMGITQIFDMRIPDNATEYSLETVPVDLDSTKRGPFWVSI